MEVEARGGISSKEELCLLCAHFLSFSSTGFAAALLLMAPKCSPPHPQQRVTPGERGQVGLPGAGTPHPCASSRSPLLTLLLFIHFYLLLFSPRSYFLSFLPLAPQDIGVLACVYISDINIKTFNTKKKTKEIEVEIMLLWFNFCDLIYI